ncbi:hypothetical protein DLM78_10295 [Leptospira stimsonii]|uniref:Uncharacterized protein n=1 Tax=Leptospira stimsonii TaxID=2202203 RepID=A0A8B3CSQ9_9LEPT|nr:hypothetical protein DLM78_10295 [Leptospira stimsonii]
MRVILEKGVLFFHFLTRKFYFLKRNCLLSPSKAVTRRGIETISFIFFRKGIEFCDLEIKLCRKQDTSNF